MQITDFFNVASSEGHCEQCHDHSQLPWPLPACDWQGNLEWQMNDTGYNEGAAVAAQVVAKYGLGFPAPLDGLAGTIVGNTWKRRDMIRFACDVAKRGRPWEATAIAIAGQWHNCHAFKCLVAHAPEVAWWLVSK